MTGNLHGNIDCRRPCLCAPGQWTCEIGDREPPINNKYLLRTRRGHQKSEPHHGLGFSGYALKQDKAGNPRPERILSFDAFAL
jgi:hypothetical protein